MIVLGSLYTAQIQNLAHGTCIQEHRIITSDNNNTQLLIYYFKRVRHIAIHSHVCKYSWKASLVHCKMIKFTF